MRATVFSIVISALTIQMAYADDTKIQPTEDESGAHKLIAPTSPGSSGNADLPAATGNSGYGSQVDGGAGAAAPSTSNATNPNTGPLSPYPDATNPTGHLDGGSVIGTGAMTSAHPGH